MLCVHTHCSTSLAPSHRSYCSCCFMIALPLFALSSAFHLLFTTFFCVCVISFYYMLCICMNVYYFCVFLYSLFYFYDNTLFYLICPTEYSHPLPSPCGHRHECSTLLFVKCLLCICKLFSFVCRHFIWLFVLFSRPHPLLSPPPPPVLCEVLQIDRFMWV